MIASPIDEDVYLLVSGWYNKAEDIDIMLRASSVPTSL